MSPRIFQRKSLRGQTKYFIQIFTRPSLLACIILILNLQEERDDSAQFALGHASYRLLLQFLACLNKHASLLVLESKIRQERFKALSHLRETIDTQLCHAIVSTRYVAAPKSRTNPRERFFMAGVLVETYRCHESYAKRGIAAVLQLEHETSVSVQEARDIREICTFGNT